MTKITVIIPTKEREETLKWCLQTVVAQEYENLEIIVSDNCSSSATKKIINETKDPRIVYIRPPRRLGMSEHWEWALSHASGDWITFLGDDDGLLPDAILRFSKLVANTDLRAVGSNLCTYQWPIPSENIKSSLTIKSEPGVKIQNSHDYLNKVMKGSAGHKRLPCIYMGGFVHKSVIEEIRNLSGVFFNSITPDIYSGIAISRYVDNYIFSNEPFAVGGTSRHSNGYQVFSNKSDMQFFEESKMKFLENLGDGNIGSYPIIIYESFLKSKHIGRNQQDTGLEFQIALAITNAKEENKERISEYCAQLIEMNHLSQKKIKYHQAAIKLSKIKSKISRRLFPHPRTTVNLKINEISNIHEACQLAGKYLTKTKFDSSKLESQMKHRQKLQKV